jgi:hypothetical protein
MRNDPTSAMSADREHQPRRRPAVRSHLIARALARPTNATAGNIVVTLGLIAGLLLAWTIIVVI